MVADARTGYGYEPRAAVAPRSSASHQAFQVLRFTFAVAPIVAGLDKFFNLLTNWGRYLSAEYAALSPFNVATTMYLVGIVEIVAGAIVAFKPRIGAWLVAAWLAGIIVNLALHGGYWDIAWRDVGLMLSAVALGLLARRHR